MVDEGQLEKTDELVLCIELGFVTWGKVLVGCVRKEGNKEEV